MSLGAALRKLRRDRRMTQRAVAERAGLQVSYVSRIETGRIQPTVGTVGRLARALEVEVAELFQPDPKAAPPPHRCPVSHSGECIGRLIREHSGLPPGGRKARYGQEELRLLRVADYLILHGPPKARAALATMLDALMQQSAAPRRRQ